ncbi:hypothetical protein RJT34_24498 [Clitoria ternatea]|uniref:Uncharacterized protein n=1 Tax=Clitoria ternatea TaxID=43366 RepID=A0AAN9IJ97_CLITE
MLLWSKSGRGFRNFVESRLFFWVLFGVAFKERDRLLFLGVLQFCICERHRLKCVIQLMDTKCPVIVVHDDNFIGKLDTVFSESLQIQDAKKSEQAPKGYNIDNYVVGERNLCGGFDLQETKLEMRCLKTCSTFPCPGMMLHSSCSQSSDEEVDTPSTELLSKKSPDQNRSCSVSLSTPSKLVSAMKGSREKQGGSQVKFSVKWAPDVYDPAPTLLSHTVKNKKQQKSRIKKSEKKRGKKSQKVSYSKGCIGRVKKQYHHWWLESADIVIKASTEFDDLDVISHDSYFGTNYFKRAVHCSVGEAL